MKSTLLAAAAALCIGAVAPAAFAQGGPPGGMPQMPSEIALDTIGMDSTIEIDLPGILDPEDDQISEHHSSYGDNVSPEISWTAVDGAETYALIMQDPFEMNGNSMVVLHWVVYNIPGDTTSLPAGIQPGASVASVPGAMQANNITQQPQYAGPGAPPGAPHNYTFQIFALDSSLDVAADVSYDDLLAAMDGHIIAAGVTTRPYAAPEGAQMRRPGGN